MRKRCHLFSSTDFSCDGFNTLIPLALTPFKTKGSTLKYAPVALDQERTLSSFIVSKFEYAQCIGDRPVKLKTISSGVCRFRFL